MNISGNLSVFENKKGFLDILHEKLSIDSFSKFEYEGKTINVVKITDDHCKFFIKKEKIKMNKQLKQVKEFHNLFNHPVLDKPQIPSDDRCTLRVSLLQEELKELQEAIEQNDLVEVADALVDIQYVLCGAIHEFGLGNKFSKLFDEVQKSNMSKACNTLEEVQSTIEYYNKEKDTVCYFKQKDDKFLVYRTVDNKVLKSINYSPANLKVIL